MYHWNFNKISHNHAAHRLFEIGSRGDDLLNGTAGTDFIFGLAGNDVIRASSGFDFINGGRGFDTVTFQGSILDADITLLGNPWSWMRNTTALVTTYDANGDFAGVSTIKNVEALYFEEDDYTLYLDGRNNAALAGDDTANAVENIATVLDTDALLANDTEFDGDEITVVSVDATSTLGADISFLGGKIVYLPGTTFDALAHGETVTDTFTYTVDDGFGGTDIATVTVTVTGTNDVPVLVVDDAAISMDEGVIDVAAGINAQDADAGANLTYDLSGDDAALFTINADTGEISFASSPDFEAPADANADNVYEITITVTDEFGAADSADLSVSINDIWDPIALSQGFETEATGGFYTAADTDGSVLADGAEVDLVNNGQATVDSTAASDGLLGFDLSWVNTRGGSGISDGDYIGVTDYTGDVSQFPEGAQGYEMQDADGLLRLTFDTVDLSARADSTVVKISLDAFVNDTGWEADDLVSIYVETNLGTVMLLDTAGADIDDLNIEGIWQSLSVTLGADVTEATLVVELDSNSSAENLYIDNVAIQEVFYIGQSFETEATGGKYEFAAADGTTVGIGETVDLLNVDGLATVDSTDASAAQLGYDLSWVNTRGDTGISDADFIGVQSFAGVVGEYTDGVQGYELSDADGLLVMTFDEIDLSAVGEVTVSLDTFIQSTGWEADDLINIYVVTDQGTVSLLDTTGQDIDDMGVEGAWMTLSTTLGDDIDTAQLVVEFDSNSASEAIFFDNVIVTSDPETPSVDPEPELMLISAIQGEGDASDYDGETAAVSAVVTLVTDDGFYLQEEDADSDGNALTSEGIFVYTAGAYAVSVADLVQVTGTVTEFFGLTEITSVTSFEVTYSNADLPALTTVTLSPDIAPNYEALEGMLLSVETGTDEALTVTENFNLDRYGQISIAAGIQTQPTQIYDAQTQADEITALTEANENASLLLDDGSSVENPTEFAYLPGGAGDDGNGVLDSGDDFADTGTTVRLGAEIADSVDGVLTFSYDEWTLNVTDTIEFVEDTNSGAREETPADVGGTLQVASYNVLNFFTTFSGGTGPDGDLSPRGADNQDEFDRQSSKIAEGIIGTGAEVVALQEIENNGTEAIGTLVDILNAEGTDATYAYVDPTGTGDFVGTDAITTGIIYDSSAVTLVYSDYIVFDETSADATYGIASSLGGLVGEEFNDYQRNRPSVAATFTDNESGETFTVVSSHFKSKGDSDLQDVADAAEVWLADSANAGSADYAQVTNLLADLYADPNFDQGDGQGFWNAVRLDGAVELADWVANDYNGGGVTNYLLLGDMNSYAEEDAVQYLDDDAGLTDLIDTFIGQDDAYSYVFNGQQGTLDQGLGDSEIADNVTGVTEWHINADEPDLIGYDTDYNDPGFYNDGVYASSDHDPLIIGLDFTTTNDLLVA
ncbi:ExeM/NucH family extracellular endonuclease [Yoonia maritima]|uniref:ExeM/NucH family extracellular endonuclease n=1 Tax=Yoonia maritima TaxID=1435347 RepID=UPI000D0F68AA|nr:ExeM/NucH family extracellular endonuclease [Yoonia maritima]